MGEKRRVRSSGIRFTRGVSQPRLREDPGDNEHPNASSPKRRPRWFESRKAASEEKSLPLGAGRGGKEGVLLEKGVCLGVIRKFAGQS